MYVFCWFRISGSEFEPVYLYGQINQEIFNLWFNPVNLLEAVPVSAESVQPDSAFSFALLY